MRIYNKLAFLLCAVSFCLCSCTDKSASSEKNAESSEIKTEQSIPETTEPKITEKKNIDIFDGIDIHDYFTEPDKKVCPPLVYFNTEDNPYWQEYSKNNADDETGYFISETEMWSDRETITLEFRYGEDFESFLDSHSYVLGDTSKEYTVYYEEDYLTMFSNYTDREFSKKMSEYVEKEIQKEYPDTEVIWYGNDKEFESEDCSHSYGYSNEENYEAVTFEDAKKKAESRDSELYHFYIFGERWYFLVKNTADNTYALAGVYIYQRNGEPAYCEYEYPFLFCEERDDLFSETPDNDVEAGEEANDYLWGYLGCA